ncbi:MAG TPA: glycosyltransferase [Gaiellaceae bacterium]|nr:glycosyltransferase [Gaiellaceae bacterium]
MSKRAVFWGSVDVLAYAYAGFPLLVAARALVRKRPIAAGDGLPSVTVVVPAHNEAGIIEEKLANVASVGYPPERLEIIVASDGSDDGTNDLVRAHPAGARLLPLPRVGKNAALNEAAAAARGEIVVFTDADAKMAEHALHYLVAPFADPEVGGVAGERRHGDVSRPKSLAARTRHSLRELLSRSGSVTSAEGQIYAVRRELVQPAPPNVPDDFWISTRVVAAHSRLVYEPRALTHPFVGVTRVHDPFERKVRMTGPSLRALWLGRELLNPRVYGFYALQLFSHKLLRRLVFVPVVALAVTAIALSRQGRVYRLAALAQAGLHGAALAGLLLRGTRLGRLKALKAPLAFDLGNAAAAVALAQQLRGRRPRDDMWEPQRVVTQTGSSDEQP